jgi:hypothetical protein
MFAFRQATHKLRGDGNMVEHMSGVPSIIVDGLMARFTEIPRGSTQYGHLHGSLFSQVDSNLLTSLQATNHI